MLVYHADHSLFPKIYVCFSYFRKKLCIVKNPQANHLHQTPWNNESKTVTLIQSWVFTFKGQHHIGTDPQHMSLTVIKPIQM